MDRAPMVMMSAAVERPGLVSGKSSNITTTTDPPSPTLVEVLRQLSHLDLSSRLTRKDWQLKSFGGYSDIYKAVLHDHYRGAVLVAIKHFRVALEEKKAFAEAIAREIQIWSALQHPNVLPFIGYMSLETFPALVSEWMDNGTVTAYLKSKRNRSEARYPLITGICDGLAYLHSNGVVHADLKPDNILVSNSGIPLLADFGISRLLVASKTLMGTHTLKGNTRYMAVELLNQSAADPASDHQFQTKESDVWAFGMVVYEILTGYAPYMQLNDAQVMFAILRADFPKLPPKDGSTNQDRQIYNMCMTCWNHNPSLRPTVSVLKRRLGSILTFQFTTSPSYKLHKQLSGHKRYVHSVAFSLDGQYLVSASVDGTICLWNSHTGELVSGPISAHADSVTSVAFAPNGHFFSSSSNDKSIRVWDADPMETAKGPLLELLGHTDHVVHIAYSPNGAYIVSGSRDRTIRIWDVGSGAMVCKPLVGHDGFVTAVAYSPDGKYIASGSADETLCVWDAQKGELALGPLLLHQGWVDSVAFSPDGQRIVSGSWDQTICIWDAKTGGLFNGPLYGHTNYVYSVVYTPDGRHIISGSRDKSVCIWDAATGKMACGPIVNHSHWVVSIACSRDGRYIAAGNNGVTIWEVDWPR